MANVELTDLDADTAITGIEELAGYDSVQGAVKVTVTQIYIYIKAAIQSISELAGVDTNDSFMMLENGTTLKPCPIDTVVQRGIDLMWSRTAETDVDAADVFVLKDGATTEKIVTAAILAAYIFTTNRTATLNVATLDAIGSIVDATGLLVVEGSTPKKTTYSDLATKIYTTLATHVTALDAVTTSQTTDVFYTIQGGTAKKATLAQMLAAAGSMVTGPGSATTGRLASWSGAAALADTYTVAATFSASGSSTEIATTLGIRAEMDDVIADSTAIATALADADEVLVEDQTGPYQRRATFTSIWTWIVTKIQALAAKTTPVDADILMIQDSAASNAPKELTLGNLWDNRYLADMKAEIHTHGVLSTLLVSNAPHTERTISTGIISVTQAWHSIDTESDAASDDLVTISGFSVGTMYYFQAEDTDRTVVFKHGTGNLRCNGGTDLSLADTYQYIRAFSIDGTNLICDLISGT